MINVLPHGVTEVGSHAFVKHGWCYANHYTASRISIQPQRFRAGQRRTSESLNPITCHDGLGSDQIVMGFAFLHKLHFNGFH